MLENVTLFCRGKVKNRKIIQVVYCIICRKQSGTCYLDTFGIVVRVKANIKHKLATAYKERVQGKKYLQEIFSKNWFSVQTQR